MWWLLFVLCVAEAGVTKLTKEGYLPDDPFSQPPALELRHGRGGSSATCSQCSCGEGGRGALRVVGGQATGAHEFPWLARLVYHKSFGCGASLINDKYVVTAAHCIKGFMWFLFRVTFGEHDRCDKARAAVTRFVLRMVVHDFDLTVLSNDIALLRLNEPVHFSRTIRPVCLPQSDAPLYVGTDATVAGWGATGEGDKWSCTVLRAQLPVLANADCQRTSYNSSKIKEVMMCAGYPETAHKDACTGDSGGPLVAENENNSYDLIGIVSWGYGCARKGYPGVYTRVNRYLDWITNNTQDACYCQS